MANLAFNNLYEPKKASFDNMYISQDSVSIEEPKRCSRSTWKRAWIDFTESTTIHGIRHIWTADAFAFRRFVICCLLIIFVCLWSLVYLHQILYTVMFQFTESKKVNIDFLMLYSYAVTYLSVRHCVPSVKCKYCTN